MTFEEKISYIWEFNIEFCICLFMNKIYVRSRDAIRNNLGEDDTLFILSLCLEDMNSEKVQNLLRNLNFFMHIEYVLKVNVTRFSFLIL